MAISPDATSTSPSVSNGRARDMCPIGSSGIFALPNPTTATANGTSIRISTRQFAASSTQPESSGAISGPSMTTVPEMPTAVARLPSGNMLNASDVASGTIIPAQRPCKLLAAINQPRLRDPATATANSPKPAAEARNSRFWPNRSAAHPAVSCEMPIAIRNTGIAHSAPAPTSAEISGRARTMNVVSIRTTSEARTIAVIAATG